MKACFAVILSIFLFVAQEDEGSRNQKVPQHDAAAIIRLATVRVLDREGRPVTDLKIVEAVVYFSVRDVTPFQAQSSSFSATSETICQVPLPPSSFRLEPTL